MATIKLKGKRGSTLKKAWAYYSGSDVSKPVTAVARGFPTTITASLHGLPNTDIPVSLLSLGELTTKNTDGQQSFAAKDRITATKIDADNFSVKVDSTMFNPFVAGGTLVYTPPKDLTSYTARAQFRAAVDAPDPPLLELTHLDGITLGGVEGTIDMTLTDEQTTTLPEDLTYWNLELEDPTGAVTRFAEGTLTLTGDVNRSGFPPTGPVGGPGTVGQIPGSVTCPAVTGAGTYSLANAGMVFKNAAGAEIWRILGTDPNYAANWNSVNLYIGHEAGKSNPSVNNSSAGYGNTGIGAQALKDNTSGGVNVAVGAFAMWKNVTGRGNSVVGYSSCSQLLTGQWNVALGCYIGNNADPNGKFIGDDYMVFIGVSSGKLSPTKLTNGIAIGANTIVQQSNTAVLGSADLTDAYFGSVAGLAKLHGKGDAIVFPDADPHVVGAAYWAGGVLTRSAG